MAWTLRPGDTIVRKVLHDIYGGGRQGGVSPSQVSPNVMLFADAKSGVQHGYTDGWHADGMFHYTGEGQRGDQRIVGGNRAIAEHAQVGRAIRLFEGVGGTVKYVGEFRLADADPIYTTEAPETGGGPIRNVLVFRLAPVATIPVPLSAEPGSLPVVAIVVEVPIEASTTEKFYVDPDREPYEAEKREAKLVKAFAEWLDDQGHTAIRFKIVPIGETKPIFSDLWVPSLNLMVEAKGSATRECVRMAIGQLIDYGRFQPEAEQAILLPSEPRADLIDLIAKTGMILFWQDGAGFKKLSA